jgi:hypothetical protein
LLFPHAQMRLMHKCACSLLIYKLSFPHESFTNAADAQMHLFPPYLQIVDPSCTNAAMVCRSLLIHKMHKCGRCTNRPSLVVPSSFTNCPSLIHKSSWCTNAAWVC